MAGSQVPDSRFPTSLKGLSQSLSLTGDITAIEVMQQKDVLVILIVKMHTVH